jgi:hypothetical protein
VLSLGVALSASGALLAGFPAAGKPPPPDRVPVATAWPGAQRAVVPANLPDGTAYQPMSFLDAHTSVGTALSRNGRSLRLLLVGARQPVRQLRVVPLNAGRSIRAVAVAGTVLAWVEGTSQTGIEIWKADRQGGRPAQRVASADGSADSYHSQYDLVINDGRLYWASSGKDDLTNIRSVALAGGPVTTRAVPGSWQLSAWPWLADGVTATSGTTRLRNLVTGQEVGVSGAGPRSATRCTPAWCQVVSLSRAGFNRIELMHPDGTSRQSVAGVTAATVIADAAPLDRFEVFSELGPDSDLTGNTQLLVYEIATRRTVQVSPDAGKVSYSNGVLWWATGNQQNFIWHALDLRTV